MGRLSAIILAFFTEYQNGFDEFFWLMGKNTKENRQLLVHAADSVSASRVGIVLGAFGLKS